MDKWAGQEAIDWLQQMRFSNAMAPITPLWQGARYNDIMHQMTDEEKERLKYELQNNMLDSEVWNRRARQGLEVINPWMYGK